MEKLVIEDVSYTIVVNWAHVIKMTFTGDHRSCTLDLVDGNRVTFDNEKAIGAALAKAGIKLPTAEFASRSDIGMGDD